MKKLIVLLLAICMAFSLTACGPKEVEYTLGLGVTTSLDSTKDGKVQVDGTVAAVVLDANGKIVACAIDAIQNKANIEAGAVVVSNLKTKMELGDDYNMVKYSGGTCTKEWYQQANAFAAYCVGKTIDDIKKMELVDRATVDGQHAGYMVTTDKDLFASCSIQLTDFVAAVVKAGQDEFATTFKTAAEFKLGVAACNSYLDSTAAAEGTEGLAALYSEFAACVVADGKIIACLNDATQPKVKFNLDGTITSKTFAGTKRELKDNYNMVKYSGGECTHEWYEQSASFSAYCVGKTAEEVQNLPTADRATVDGKHAGYMVTTDTELFASVSIQITGMKNVIAKAARLAENPLH